MFFRLQILQEPSGFQLVNIYLEIRYHMKKLNSNNNNYKTGFQSQYII